MANKAHGGRQWVIFYLKKWLNKAKFTIIERLKLATSQMSYSPGQQHESVTFKIKYKKSMCRVEK